MHSDMIEPKETDVAGAFKFILEESWPANGDKFFRSSVRHLATALGVRYAFIAQCTDSTRTRIRTLAFWAGKDFGENIEKNLAGAPCENVVKGNLCYYPKDLQVLYPLDKDVAALGAQSYLGMPFYDSSDKLLGHIAVLDTKPMNDDIREKPIFKMFATRTGVELERMQAHEELKKHRNNLEELVDQRTKVIKIANEQLQREVIEHKIIEEKLKSTKEKYQGLFESCKDGISICDIDGGLLGCNKTLEDMTGYTFDELKEKTYEQITPEKWHKMEADIVKNQLLIKGYCEEYEKEYIRKDGGTVSVSVRVFTTKCDQGKTTLVWSCIKDITKRKRDEKNLKISRKKYQDLYDNAPDMFASIDAKIGKIIECNQTLAKVLGYTKDEIIGRHVTFVYHPDCEEDRKKLFQQFVNEGSAHDVELQLKKKDGSKIDVSLDLSVVRDKNRKVLSSRSIWRDITERKKAEQELEQSNEKYRQFMATIRDAVMLFDVEEEKFIEVNKECERLYGYSQEEFLHLKIKDISAESKKSKEAVRNLAVKGSMNIDVRYHRKKDGTVFPVEMSASTFDWNGRKVIGCVIKDITERKKMETKLYLQNDALEATVHPIMTTDLEGAIEWCNEAFVKMTGYSREEIIGKNPRMLKSGKHDLKFYKNLWQTIKSGQVWRGEMINRRKDGTLYPEEQTITPIKDQNGNITHFVAIKQDITERKRAEGIIKTFNEELEQRVEDRTKELKLFKSLIDQSNDAIFVIDPATGRFLNINNKVSESLGYSRKEILKMKIKDVVTTISDDDSWRKHVKEIRQKGSMFIQGKHKRKDGSIFPVEANVKITKEADKEYLVVVARDTTERERVEKVLRFTQFAVDHNADPTYWVRADGRICYVNNAGCQVLGYSQEELQLMTVSEIDPDFPSGAWPEHWQKMKDMGSTTFEAHHKTKSGRVFPVEIRTSFIEYQNEEYIWAYARDITERKKSEEALKSSKLNLEQKNIALSEIIAQIEIEKDKIKESVMLNVDQLLMPNLKKLRRKGTPLDRKSIDLLEKNLGQLTSAFGGNVSQKRLKLTPREIEICNMIKNGLSSKEIADLLYISYRSVELHRTHIRKKLGISHKDVNLTSYLQSF